jgi:hypothetical protein
VAVLALAGCTGGESVARGAAAHPRPGGGAGGADGAIEPGGSPREGSIGEEGERDRHAFVAQEGQRLAVAVVAATGSDLDPYVRIYGPDGELLSEDDDGGDSLNSLAALVVRRGGRHVAEVAAFQDRSTGDYAVSVESDEPPRDGEVVLEQAGSLAEGADVARFEFEGGEGDDVLVAVNADGGGFDPVVTLLDPSGAEIGSDDDGGSGRNSLLEATLTRSGTYTLEVTEFSHGAGSFQIVVSVS